MAMKAHTYYITFGRPPIGGSFPPSPLAAPLVAGHMQDAAAAVDRPPLRRTSAANMASHGAD